MVEASLMIVEFCSQTPTGSVPLLGMCDVMKQTLICHKSYAITPSLSEWFPVWC